ncbi:MAG TPA: hypothetical protein VJ867_05780 [Gemmatimonadaceae bacterium]|nr:hypothetical protein [Gemmatimonadaceae bacterium]
MRPRVEAGGVAWRGDARSVMAANLWLRCASRVLVRVASFRATAFHELERRAKHIPWREFVGAGVVPDFRVTTHKSRLYHSDAIAQRLKTASGGATSDAASQVFIVRVVRDEFTISADTSGELLHQRGYRLETGKAPLRETLAAALLEAAEWTGDRALVDPFCGSGTIPIEAALIARRIAPGLRRDFALSRWPSMDASIWEALLDDANERALASSPVPIRGSDRDAGAIRAAKANAARAGVETDVVFEQRSVSGASAPAPSGLIATNPPYGVRVGEAQALRDLYARFGQVMRREFPRWDVAMFASRRTLAAQTQLDLEPMFVTSNGGIRVSALSSAAGRLLH